MVLSTIGMNRHLASIYGRIALVNGRTQSTWIPKGAVKRLWELQVRHKGLKRR